MAKKKKFDSVEDRNINMSGNENVNIDPVHIDTTIIGQVRDEYKDICSIVTTIHAGGKLTARMVEDVHRKVKDIVKLAEKAKDRATKNIIKHDELDIVIEIMCKARNAEKVIDMKYILESDNIESLERRALLSGWTRSDAKKIGKSGMESIDIPVLDKNKNDEER